MTRIDELRKEYYYSIVKGKFEDVSVSGYAKFLEQKLIEAEKLVKNIAYKPMLADKVNF